MKRSINQISQSIADRINTGNVRDIAREVWWILAKNKQLGRLDQLVEEVETRIAKKNNRLRAKIVFAMQPTPRNIEDIKSKLEKRFQKEVDVNTEIDPSILGGFRVSIDDYTIDLSYGAKLKQLKIKLAGANE